MMKQVFTLNSLLHLFLKNWKAALLSCILSGVVSFSIAIFLVPPIYITTVSVYISNGAGTGIMSLDDFTASQKLAATCRVIMSSPPVLRRAAQGLPSPLSPGELEQAVRITVPEGTQILQITVEAADSRLSARLCSLIAEAVPAELSRLVPSAQVVQINPAETADSPSSPNLLFITVLGALAGGMAFVVILILRYALSGERPTVNPALLGVIPESSFQNREELRRRYQEIWRRLSTLTVGQGGQVCFTDCREDGSLTCLNTAIAAALDGRRVLVTGNVRDAAGFFTGRGFTDGLLKNTVPGVDLCLGEPEQTGCYDLVFRHEPIVSAISGRHGLCVLTVNQREEKQLLRRFNGHHPAIIRIIPSNERR